MHIYQNIGFYNVSLKVTSNNGCSDSLDLNNYVSVFPRPVAGFNADPTEANVLKANIQFIDKSQGANSWSYNFGDTTTSLSQNPTHKYNLAGKFDVIQYVQNQFGCSDSISDTIIITKVTTIYIPNAFTPDNNGHNQKFVPIGIYIDNTDFEMDIFNRWDEIVFKTTDYLTGWDGTANQGKYASGHAVCPEGVYIYIIKARDTDGFIKTYKGTVTLLR